MLSPEFFPVYASSDLPPPHGHPPFWRCLYAIIAVLSLALPAAAARAKVHPALVLLDAMTTELHRAFTSLGKARQPGASTSSCRPTSSVTRSQTPALSPFAPSTERWLRAPQTASAWPTCRSASARPRSTTPTEHTAPRPSTACNCRSATSGAIPRRNWPNALDYIATTSAESSAANGT